MADVEELTELPALAAARSELATGMYPAPEDCLTDVDPITGLFYVEQWCYALLARWIGASDEASEAPTEAQEQVAQVLDAIGQATGNLDAACALMGVIPPEATER